MAPRSISAAPVLESEPTEAPRAPASDSGPAPDTDKVPRAPTAHDTITSAPVTETPLAEKPTAETAPAPTPEITPALPATPLSAWQLSGAAITGLAHHRKGLPCQDAVAWHNTTRPILALSDGAGSAPVSEQGAAALVRGVSRFCVSMEDALASWLDDPVGDAQAHAELWSRRILTHARGLLEDLANAERRSVRDLRATLLLAVLGKAHCFWWQVGDGVIVGRSASGLRTLGSPRKAKGEFANQTCFVDTASPSQVQFGIVPSLDILGLALMSDGGAEKLVAHDGSQVASRLGAWFDAVVQQALSADRLAQAFHEPAMCERTTLDDRSIVLAARN